MKLGKLHFHLICLVLFTAVQGVGGGHFFCFMGLAAPFYFILT